ncbi:hypothetical protein [Aliivibrio logei]|uniref:hypothetical protein n=1 Tax=Aliivibrio logei TaxID=688 RepID=UPI0035C8AE1F
MMAITIRHTEKHEKMIDELKLLTQKKTSSGALIDGGYLALKYQSLYQNERVNSQDLQSKLYKLQRKVDDYLSSLESLRS